MARYFRAPDGSVVYGNPQDYRRIAGAPAGFAPLPTGTPTAHDPFPDINFEPTLTPEGRLHFAQPAQPEAPAPQSSQPSAAPTPAVAAPGGLGHLTPGLTLEGPVVEEPVAVEETVAEETPTGEEVAQMKAEGVIPVTSPEEAFAVAEGQELATQQLREQAEDDIIAGEVAKKELEVEEAGEQARLKGELADRLGQMQAEALEEDRRSAARFDKEMATMSAQVDELANTRMDPNRMFRDMGTNRQIGLTMGAVAAGFLSLRGFGKGNPVLSTIERAINRDIAAQERDIQTRKAGISARGNLISHGLSIDANRRSAQSMAKNIAYEQTAREAEALAARTKSAVGQENLKTLAQELRIKAEQAKADWQQERHKRYTDERSNRLKARKEAAQAELAELKLAAAKAPQPAVAGRGRGAPRFPGDAEVAGRRVEELSEAQQKRALFDDMGLVVGLAPKGSGEGQVSKGRESTRGYFTMRKQLNRIMHNARALGPRWGLMPKAARSEAEVAHRSDVMDLYRRYVNEITGAAMSKEEAAALEEAVPTIETILGSKTLPAFSSYGQRIDDKFLMYLRSLGIRTDPTQKYKADVGGKYGAVATPSEAASNVALEFETPEQTTARVRKASRAREEADPAAHRRTESEIKQIADDELREQIRSIDETYDDASVNEILEDLALPKNDPAYEKGVAARMDVRAKVNAPEAKAKFQEISRKKNPTKLDKRWRAAYAKMRNASVKINNAYLSAQAGEKYSPKALPIAPKVDVKAPPAKSFRGFGGRGI